jgi:hypothetical protein
MEATFKGMRFTDEDVVDAGSFIPNGEYNPHNVRPWAVEFMGTIIAVVFASHEQDALDAAVDGGKMDGHMISNEDMAELERVGQDEDVTRLGNAGEPFDLTYIGLHEMPNPPFSFVALLNAITETV